MKASYLNAITDGLRRTTESLFGFVPVKREVKINSFLEPHFEHVLQLHVSGDLQGFFAISFTHETAVKMVNVMTGSENVGELDENAISCLEELGNMIKGAVINELSAIKYQCDVPVISLMKKNEVAPFPNSTLVVDADSDFGKFELHYSVN